MAAEDLDHSASAVARLYRGLIHGFVLDLRDAAELDAIGSPGVEVLLADTLAPPGAGRLALAASVLGFAHRLSGSNRSLG